MHFHASTYRQQEIHIDGILIYHLQENKSVGLNIQQIRDIEFYTNIPLVIHGGSGVPLEQRKMLAATSNICKFNIGTELRMVFGQALRSAINADKLQFDRIQILKETINPIRNAAIDVLINLGIPEAKQV